MINRANNWKNRFEAGLRGCGGAWLVALRFRTGKQTFLQI